MSEIRILFMGEKTSSYSNDPLLTVYEDAEILTANVTTV